LERGKVRRGEGGAKRILAVLGCLEFGGLCQKFLGHQPEPPGRREIEAIA